MTIKIADLYEELRLMINLLIPKHRFASSNHVDRSHIDSTYIEIYISSYEHCSIYLNSHDPVNGITIELFRTGFTYKSRNQTRDSIGTYDIYWDELDAKPISLDLMDLFNILHPLIIQLHIIITLHNLNN